MSEQASLELCNLLQKGKSMKEAKAFLSKKDKIVDFDSSEKEPKKLSLAERKEAISKELEELGYESPNNKESIAKFQEAIDSAKAEIEAEKEAEKEAEIEAEKEEGKDLL